MNGLLVDCTLRSSAVLVLAAVAAWMLRQHSAAVRHAVWLAALALVLAFVPLSFVRPALRIPLYSPAPEAEIARPRPPAPIAGPGGERLAVEQVAGRGEDRAYLPHRESAALPLLWLLGSMVLGLRLVRSRIRLGHLRRAARPIGSLRLREGRSVGLLSSEDLPAPVAFGILRPTVMIPADIGAWPAERLEVVLAHELSHLRRGDPLALLVAEVARVVHWFNPLAWYAFARLAQERERACDDQVVEDGLSPVVYAEHLVSLAVSLARVRTWPSGVFPMARGPGLEARLVALLTPAVRRGRMTGTQRLAVALPALLVLAALAAVSGVRTAPAVAGSTALDRTLPRPRPTNAPVVTPPAIEAAPDELLVEAAATSPAAGEVFGPADARPIVDLDDPLSERLADGEPQAAWPAEAEIAASPERAMIERLLVAARHEKQFDHDLVGERAAWALAQVRDGRIIASLVAALDDPDWRIQTHAAWALATIGAAEAQAPLGRLLDRPNWRVRAQATSSLLALGADLPLDALARLSRDPAWQVRIGAVEFLAQKDAAEARPRLTAMLDDPHGGTRIQVGAALAGLDPR